MRVPVAQNNTSQNPTTMEVSQSYIQLVQHLIEKCLLFHMDRDECIKALAQYARVQPIVTVSVWKELEKANKEFFISYFKYRTGRQFRALREITEEPTGKLSSKSDNAVKLPRKHHVENLGAAKAKDNQKRAQRELDENGSAGLLQRLKAQQALNVSEWKERAPVCHPRSCARLQQPLIPRLVGKKLQKR